MRASVGWDCVWLGRSSTAARLNLPPRRFWRGDAECAANSAEETLSHRPPMVPMPVVGSRTVSSPQVNRTAAGSIGRRVRPTLRCLRDDLGLALPTVPAASLDDIDDPVLRKARSLGPAFPENQVRIVEIEDTLVYRFTHGRMRVLTWRSPETGVIWVCAADLRRENEGYDEFIQLHRQGLLLPSAEDDRRLRQEAGLALARQIAADAGSWLAHARKYPGQECRFALIGGAEVVLMVEAGEFEAVWLAVPTLLAAKLGLPPKIRTLIVAAIEQALGVEAEYEERHDWPTGRLRNYELVHLWLRQTPID